MFEPSKRSLFPMLLALLVLGLLAACGGGAETDAGDAAPASDSADAAPADTSAPMEPLGDATISGTISYQGAVPNLRPITMNADPACDAKHDGPVQSQALVLGDGNTLGNVLVRVKWEGGPVGTPSQPVVMDQQGCLYTPHVMGVQVDQEFLIKNSDNLLHNVHSLSEVNPQFNRAMPATVTEAKYSFAKEEDPFKIKCDVHPWMGAWVTVTNHPFFSVSSQDGTYEITGLPAGTYEVEAWHEELGPQTATVTVADGGAGTADFSFTRGG